MNGGITVWLCHADSHSCYHLWTVYKKRPAGYHRMRGDVAEALAEALVERLERELRKGALDLLNVYGDNGAESDAESHEKPVEAEQESHVRFD